MAGGVFLFKINYNFHEFLVPVFFKVKNVLLPGTSYNIEFLLRGRTWILHLTASLPFQVGETITKQFLALKKDLLISGKSLFFGGYYGSGYSYRQIGYMISYRCSFSVCSLS